MYVEEAVAISRPASSLIRASTKITVAPASMVFASQRSSEPTLAARKKLTFISALATLARRPFSEVTALAPMDESNIAARKPPWMTPPGLANRSSARISQVELPGTDLSTQRNPRVKSQLGGT